MQRTGQRDVCQHHGQGGEQWRLHAKQARPLSSQSNASKQMRKRGWVQTPGTNTQSPSLTSSLLISLSALKISLSRLDQALHMESSKSSSVFVSLSSFSLAETNKGSANPAANVLLLDG